MPELIDNGLHGVYVREDLDTFHQCTICKDGFETTRPMETNEALVCTECYYYAVFVIERWWQKKVQYKKTNCGDCGIKIVGQSCKRGSDRLCSTCMIDYVN
jgi:hypothetical protein